MNVFERLQSGETVSFTDPQYSEIFEVASRTMKLLVALNNSADMVDVRKLMGDIRVFN